MESIEVLPATGKAQGRYDRPPGGEDDGNDGGGRKKPVVRKRTKTGCMTCRKRRIKCDEGRPRCGNCIKSKRECEGYNQRVVFKETMGIYGTPYGVMGGCQIDPSHAYANSMVPGHVQPSSHNSHPLLAPKPPSFDFHGGPLPPHVPPGYGMGQPPPTPSSFNFNDLYNSHPMPPPSVTSASSSSQPLGHNSMSGAPWGGYTGPASESPPSGAQYRLDSGVPASRGLGSREGVISAAYDQDNGLDYSDDEMDSGSDVEEIPDGLDQRQELVMAGRLNMLIDGRAIAHHEVDETRMRTFSAYADGQTLTSYIPTARGSGLADPEALAVFRHFLHVTGPSMSLYERHPFDHTRVLTDVPVPEIGQNIWTYTFPMLSLGHPALLQAMLALASLQMANLQRIPPTAAMRHCHLAIRRIARCVRSPAKRAHPATLAATLLLGYFEVWSSDHTKWCRHLYGARILFQEVPFRHMTRTVLATKRRRRERMEQERLEQAFNPLLDYYESDVADPEFEDVDVAFLSLISGRPLDPEDYGMGTDLSRFPPSQLPTDRDIEHYEHLRDLFWWNCKMDVYQSILGATRLFTQFDEWLPCPPRAPMGRLHAIYGTFDHLVLLLGRLSEFSSEDIPRKRKANKMPGANGSSPPMFAGMFPTRGKVTVPMGFSPPRDDPSPQSDSVDDADLEQATRVALAEWDALHDAFEAFRARLGAEFQPLGDEYTDRRETPFGTAVQYRTFSVAGIWMNFYMGLICLHRAHPSMPPAAMMAAGRAARDTAPYARELGRVAAGLSDEDVSNRSEISTLVGAAFIESCFCLFVAGVQYQDSAQRHWLVRRLHDIARLTGWGSARQIADGCEASWVRAAHMGHGPPYVRTADLVAGEPLTVASNPRRIDRKIREIHEEGTAVVLAKADRAHLALGLLGLEGDLDRLRLGDD